MPLQLFDGSDSENDDVSKIKINEEFARRFEHNKRREDLQRLDEFKTKGLVSSSSLESESDSSDDGEDEDFERLITSRRRDREFFDALLKVKKQDPILKNKDVKLFEFDEEEADEEEKGNSKDKKAEKPMYLKDVMAKHLIEEGAEFGDEDEEGKKAMHLIHEGPHLVKMQGKSKEERMAIAQKEREEELKHLKNLKKQEIQEKVQKIMKTAGIHDDDIIPLSVAEIEEEFDPEEYDRMMKKAFDEKYYNAEDPDPGFGSDDDDEMEKPDFEKEDELLGLPKGWDICGSDDGFISARERALKQKMDNNSDHDLQGGEEKIEENIPNEGGRKRKRKTALLEKARQAMMDEYYKLDYEDTIGDLKTRFKYAKTKPNRFGLSASELLTVDDKELNQYVSLKKLAPYREDEWKLSKHKRYQLKMRIKELLHAGNLDKKKKHKQSRKDACKSTSSNSEVDDEKASINELNVKTENLSRKARRRRLNNLPHLRLLAYGKISSNSKGRQKH